MFVTAIDIDSKVAIENAFGCSRLVANIYTKVSEDGSNKQKRIHNSFTFPRKLNNEVDRICTNTVRCYMRFSQNFIISGDQKIRRPDEVPLFNSLTIVQITTKKVFKQ